jgi:hypothetical protein
MGGRAGGLGIQPLRLLLAGAGAADRGGFFCGRGLTGTRAWVAVAVSVGLVPAAAAAAAAASGPGASRLTRDGCVPTAPPRRAAGAVWCGVPCAAVCVRAGANHHVPDLIPLEGLPFARFHLRETDRHTAAHTTECRMGVRNRILQPKFGA